MAVYITKINGFSVDIIQPVQQMVVDYANELGIDEFGIFTYNWPDEPKMYLDTRFDGIIAALNPGDTVIVQTPIWLGVNWENAFIDHLNIYPNIKKVLFIHDVPPLMSPENHYLLPAYIDYYNKFDILIVPSQNMYDFLRKNGLAEKPYVIQYFWDHPAQILYDTKPENKKIINFAGSAEKFGSLPDWKDSKANLRIYGNPVGENRSNVQFAGHKSESLLLDDIRSHGGFGLVWGTINKSWEQYMTLNTTFKTSTYLAAGLPLIVKDNLAEVEIIKRKNLGLVVNNLEEAQEKVLQISDSEYNQMIENVDNFAKLIRNGYFTKRALVEAIFKARFD